MEIQLNQINKKLLFYINCTQKTLQIEHTAAHGQWILVWGTQELQYDSVIYRMAIEFSNILPYRK